MKTMTSIRIDSPSSFSQFCKNPEPRPCIPAGPRATNVNAVRSKNTPAVLDQEAARNAPSSCVAMYIRVSTEEQRERQSIATQKAFGEDYCSSRGLRIHRIYADDGVSGTVPLNQRPEGRKLLEDARRGLFIEVLIYKLDRLGRDTLLTLNAINEFERCGVRVRSMTEDFNPADSTGRLMLTIMSGFATHERDVIRERSIAGTQRLAKAGTWLGGIVPFGYRKQGERNQARIVIAEDEIPELGLSESEVVRRIFHMVAVEHKSCRCIADYLNQLRVPCAYERDFRLLLRGKRRQRTSGIWRAGRIRNLIVSPTYKGLHEYGKRSKSRQHEVIVRQVPGIVSEELWKKAQESLASNWLFGPRNARHAYLLRGLIKCQLCGLTFIGTCQTRPSGKVEFYYRCNGKHGARQLYGPDAKRCASKDINGQYLENLIWRDLRHFLQDPGEVVTVLASKLSAQVPDSPRLAQRSEQIQHLLKDNQEQRDRILSLYRRGRIDEFSLETQLNDIQAEADALRREQLEISDAYPNAQDTVAHLTDAAELLRQLRTRLDQRFSWDLKRQLFETLVGGITINTIDQNGTRESVVTVRYRFHPLSANCTGRGSSQRPASGVQET